MQSPLPLPSTPNRLPNMPTGVVFQDEKEYQYFCYFRDETSIELSSGFEASLWNVLVLEACDIPAIRQLVIATAALSVAMKKSAADIRDYALNKYGEALAGIREMVNRGEDSVRVALISSLLIFCFESLSGDFGRATTHIHSTIEMLVKRVSDGPQSFYFPRTTALGIRGRAAIDEDLLTAFMRLDRPSLTLMSMRTEGQTGNNRIFNLLFGQEHLEIPRGFATIAEARVYFEDIAWRITNVAQPPESLAGTWNLDGSPDEEMFPLKLKQWYEASGVLDNSSNFTFELAHWHDAFSPILNHAMSPPGESLFVSAVILHIQALAADLLASGRFSTNETGDPKPSYGHDEDEDRYPTVHAILSLSHKLVSHANFLKGFVFDLGVIPCLVSVWLLCPVQHLKAEAIEVLESMVPRREAFWDSRAAANAGRRYLEREQKE